MKKILMTAVVVIIGLFLTACGSNLDVVGQQSVKSFDTVLNTIPDNVKADEMNAGWSLSAPDGSARFIWSEDFSKSPLHDIMLEVDAQPFIKAGLDPKKLPENYAFYGDGKKMLMVGTKLGQDKYSYKGNPSAIDAYGYIVSKYRKVIGYHTALDHYNVNVGDGNLFEWAKDLNKNGTTGENQDKDIVFVLNPEPLIKAGVDPKAVDGWVYAQVNVDINGKPTEVWKFLKPFNIK